MCVFVCKVDKLKRNAFGVSNNNNNKRPMTVRSGTNLYEFESPHIQIDLVPVCVLALDIKISDHNTVAFLQIASF